MIYWLLLLISIVFSFIYTKIYKNKSVYNLDENKFYCVINSYKFDFVDIVRAEKEQEKASGLKPGLHIHIARQSRSFSPLLTVFARFSALFENSDLYANTVPQFSEMMSISMSQYEKSPTTQGFLPVSRVVSKQKGMSICTIVTLNASACRSTRNW